MSTIIRWLAGALAGAAVLAAGRASSSEGPGAESASAPVVVVVKPLLRKAGRELVLTASLIPYEEADLYAKTSGYVAEVAVQIGDRVRAGDVLAQISVPEMADELAQATAQLAAKRAGAEALRLKAELAALAVEAAAAGADRADVSAQLYATTLTRKETLHQEKAIPDQEIDEARHRAALAQADARIARIEVDRAKAQQAALEADVRVAESEVAVADAALARLKTLMSYATIRAPFDGLITARNVDPGAFVRSAAAGPAAPLLHIARTDRLRAVLEVPESDAAFAGAGATVALDLPALRRSLSAPLSRAAGALEPRTRTMRVEADLDNEHGELPAGTYARATLSAGEAREAIVIPSRALRARGAQAYVLVVAGDVAVERPVKVGYDDGAWARIAEGLQGDEQVITAATSAVGPGTTIRPVARDAAGPSGGR